MSQRQSQIKSNLTLSGCSIALYGQLDKYFHMDLEQSWLKHLNTTKYTLLTST